MLCCIIVSSELLFSKRFQTTQKRRLWRQLRAKEDVIIVQTAEGLIECTRISFAYDIWKKYRRRRMLLNNMILLLLLSFHLILLKLLLFYYYVYYSSIIIFRRYLMLETNDVGLFLFTQAPGAPRVRERRKESYTILSTKKYNLISSDKLCVSFTWFLL